MKYIYTFFSLYIYTCISSKNMYCKSFPHNVHKDGNLHNLSFKLTNSDWLVLTIANQWTLSPLQWIFSDSVGNVIQLHKETICSKQTIWNRDYITQDWLLHNTDWFTKCTYAKFPTIYKVQHNSWTALKDSNISMHDSTTFSTLTFLYLFSPYHKSKAVFNIQSNITHYILQT